MQKIVDVAPLINTKDKFSRVLFTVSSSSGQNPRIYAVDPLHQEKIRLILSESEGEIIYLRNSGEHFYAITNNENP